MKSPRILSKSRHYSLSSPWWKSAPLPSRLDNVLKLLSRERKRPVFSDFHHRLLGS